MVFVQWKNKKIVLWKLSSNCSFSIKSVWEGLGEKDSSCQVVQTSLGSGFIPKHSFIVWFSDSKYTFLLKVDRFDKNEFRDHPFLSVLMKLAWRAVPIYTICVGREMPESILMCSDQVKSINSQISFDVALKVSSCNGLKNRLFTDVQKAICRNWCVSLN